MKKHRSLVMAGIVSVLICAASCFAVEIVVQPGPYESMDTSIVNSTPDSNTSSEKVMMVADYNDTSGHLLSYALLKFTLPGSPMSVDINEVKLTMAGMPFSMVIPVIDALYVHRVTSDWDHETVTWNTPQFTFDSTPEVKLTLTQSGLLYYLEADITDLYLKWMIGDYENYGILISAILPQDLPQGVNGSIMYLFSAETDQGDSLRPKLTISAGSAVPEPATMTLLTIGLLCLVRRKRAR